VRRQEPKAATDRSDETSFELAKQLATPFQNSRDTNRVKLERALNLKNVNVNYTGYLFLQMEVDFFSPCYFYKQMS